MTALVKSLAPQANTFAVLDASDAGLRNSDPHRTVMLGTMLAALAFLGVTAVRWQRLESA